MENPKDRSGSGWPRMIAFATSFMALGILLGWFGHQQALPGDEYISGAVPLEKALTHPLALNTNRIILHINSGDPQSLEEVLATAEKLLRNYRTANHELKMEILANSEGLNLLRADVSPYKDRIERMLREYHNLSFLACEQAIRRLVKKGVNIKLLPNTGVTSSAIDRIIDGVQNGWVYLRV